MKNFPASHVTLLVCVLFSYATTAFSAPLNFIFAPIEKTARLCASAGPTWNTKVKEALDQAKARTSNFLPSQGWERILDPALLPSSDAVPTALSAADAASCESFVLYYSDPRLSEKLRGPMIAGQILNLYAGCAAEFPDLSAVIRAEWMAAFKRNGLDSLEELFDDEVRNSWRKPSEDQQFRGVCEQGLHIIRGAEFDLAASEAGIGRFLNSP